MQLFYAYLDAVEEAKRKAQPWECEVTVIPQGDEAAAAPRGRGAKPAKRRQVRILPATSRNERTDHAHHRGCARRPEAEEILRGRTRRRASRRDREGALAQRLCAGDAGARAAMAKAADARIAKGDAGPLEGIPLAIKDMFCTEGVRTTACSHILDNFVPTYELTVSAQSLARRRGAARQDQQRRIRHGLVERDLVHGPGDVAVAAQGLEHAARSGRLVRRLGRGGGGASGARRDRHRHRRLDPPARGVHRHRRHQADLRPLLALGHRRVCVLARSGRSVRAHGARRARSCCARWRATIRRTRPRSILPVPDYEAAVGKSIKGMRIGIPKEYRDRRHVGGDRKALGAGQGVAEGGRRRARRGVAAAHQIRAAGLLHRGAGGGLVQSRALRRRALRPARAAAATSSACTRTRAPAASARRCAGAS